MRKAVLILVLFPHMLFGQLSNNDQREVDSLYQLIERTQDDSARVNNLLYVADYFYRHDPDSAITICTIAAEIAEEAGDDLGLANCYGYLGYFARQKGQINKALDLFERSYQLDLKAGNQQGVAYTYSQLAGILLKNGQIEKCLSYFHKALEIHESLGYEIGIARSLGSIGTVHANQDQYETALDYYRKSLAIRKTIDDKGGIALMLNNIGSTLADMDSLEIAQLKYEQALDIYRSINDKRGEAKSLQRIADLLVKQEKHEDALRLYQQILPIAEEIDLSEQRMLAYMSIGHVLNDLGELGSAYKDAIKSYELSTKANYPFGISESACVLFQIEKSRQNYEQALQFYEIHIQMRDSINNEKTQKATIRQQTKYEFEKAQLLKEQEEKEASRIAEEQTTRRNNLQYSVIFLTILLVFGLILGLGFVKVTPTVAEGLIFFAFLIFFEFLLVLGDPFVESMTGGEPIYKLLTNALLAGAIFPAHAFLERTLKKRIIK